MFAKIRAVAVARLIVLERQMFMLNLRFTPILALALGSVLAQEASNIFEKAPPDVDEALRRRVTRFYESFVSGKFRQADAFVAEDSKDVFFAMEKKRYQACQLGTITYSDNFTKAVAVTSCDTKYFMMGREIPIKLPITSQWKLDDGEWYWYVIPISERTTMNTPIGPVPVPRMNDQGQELPPTPPPARPDMAVVAAQVFKGVKVDRNSIEINPTKASTDKVQVTNGMPGAVTVTVDSGGVAGLTVKPSKIDIGSGEDVTFVVSFNPEDPSILCRECLAHPQNRQAGTMTLRVAPTGQTFPIQVNYITPTAARN